jgi:hypothetical protein
VNRCWPSQNRKRENQWKVGIGAANIAKLPSLKTLLWYAAAVRRTSAIKQSEGLLFGAPSSLQQGVWNIEGKNPVNFSLACYLFVHGIHNDACAKLTPIEIDSIQS